MGQNGSQENLQIYIWPQMGLRVPAPVRRNKGDGQIVGAKERTQVS